MKEICVKADKDFIDEVFSFIEDELEQIDECTRKDMLVLHMIVDEIFSNISKYAYDVNPGDVGVAFESEPASNAVTIIFTDDGRPYNPLEEGAPDITLSARKRKPGGLGIFMVRNTADDIQYEYKGGKNIITIKKILGE